VHPYTARIAWSRNGARFVDNAYSRRHEWTFDGGVTVTASASPAVVPLPWSIAEAVDPEEALVASAASCHMLWFLSLAAKRGFVVERYTDDAFGVMDKDAEGKLMITRITLRPSVEFPADGRPSPEEIRSLHRTAHAECFIANSLKSEIVVEGV
jgi:organic hydroperoxide reductase OsmC/OhrA